MRNTILLFLMLISLSAAAQNLEWRTGIPDTNYNTMKDYRQNLKHYPFIKVVPDSITPAVKEARNLVYCKIGSRDLHLDAFQPAKKQKKATPAILIVHGGGWRSGNRTQHIPLAQHLAALGYTCFTVEYRLSTEALYPAAINDLKSALKWMGANAKKFNIDTSKFTVLGFSAGGQLAALAGVTSTLPIFNDSDCNKGFSGSAKAVIDIDGTLSFVHPESQEFQKPSGGASLWWIGYTQKERFDLWKEASPFTYAEQNKVPFLFLNSAVERMHAGRDDFKKLMDQKGIYTQIISFPDTPHAFCLYRPWFEPMVKHIDTFMKKVFNLN